MSMDKYLPSYIPIIRMNRLKLLGLPELATRTDIATAAHISERTLYSILFHPEWFYYRRGIPKRNGETRILFIPFPSVKAIQAWILRMILDNIRPTTYATAYKKGISISANVYPHRNNRYFLLIDIEDFFPSIKKSWVRKLFVQIGYSPEVAEILARLCTYKGMLPQGGVTSPAISNLVVARMDRRIAGYCSKKNLRFTRYADDITISSNNKASLNHAKIIIQNIIENEGFKINQEKTRIVGPSKRCTITGLVKDSGSPEFGIGRKKVLKMRGLIFNYLVNNKLDSRKYKTVDSLAGWLRYCKSIDQKSYEYLERYIRRFDEESALLVKKSSNFIDSVSNMKESVLHFKKDASQ